MGTKWWEYYAVRYFAGTVIGAAVVAFLNVEATSPFRDDLTTIVKSETSFLGVGVFAALGFAFCYIASSPMLTLHAARAHLRFSAIKTSPRTTLICLVVSTIVTVVALWRFLPPLAAAGMGIVIGGQFGLILLSAMTNFSVVESFYRVLADIRARAMSAGTEAGSPGSEYITSYRHLREHGNAVTIVALEFVLAYAILHSQSKAGAILLVFIWLLPASFAWLLGTVLESRLVSSGGQTDKPGEVASLPQ